MQKGIILTGLMAVLFIMAAPGAVAQDTSTPQIGRYQLFQGVYLQKTRNSLVDSIGTVLEQDDVVDTICTIFKMDTITGDVFMFSSWLDEQWKQGQNEKEVSHLRHRFSEGWLKTGPFDTIADTSYSGIK